MLGKRLTEIDVSTILTTLQCKPLWTFDIWSLYLWFLASVNYWQNSINFKLLSMGIHFLANACKSSILIYHFILKNSIMDIFHKWLLLCFLCFLCLHQFLPYLFNNSMGWLFYLLLKHVSTSYSCLTWAVLNCIGCGMNIRSDDPAAMKNFILSVQNRVNELKASSGDGQEKINGKRVSL